MRVARVSKKDVQAALGLAYLALSAYCALPLLWECL
jgi:hypothetical protein